MARRKGTAEIRLVNTNIQLKKILINIAKSEGKTLTQFSLFHLRKIAESYPESSRNYKWKDDEENNDGC